MVFEDEAVGRIPGVRSSAGNLFAGEEEALETSAPVDILGLFREGVSRSGPSSSSSVSAEKATLRLCMGVFEGDRSTEGALRADLEGDRRSCCERRFDVEASSWTAAAKDR